jgi:hypothetical protein
MKRLKLKSSNGSNDCKSRPYHTETITVNKKDREFLKSRIAYYLVIGLDITDACKLSDCSNDKFKQLRLDPDFEELVQKSFAENELSHITNIGNAGNKGFWQASAWYLERRFPEKYGRKDTVVHEYRIKMQTLQRVFLDVLDEVDPSLRYKVLNRLRTYKFDGTGVLSSDFSLKKLLPPPEDDTIDI